MTTPINNIDLETLPSLPLSRRKELPRISGIYFAINSLECRVSSKGEKAL
jgi:hypothetical protein